jgi:hypothetical protein
MYMKESKIFVNLGRLPKYLAAFYPSLTTESLREACGNFVIILPDQMDHSIDVTRLLGFRTHAPKVRFSFGSLSPLTMWNHKFIHVRKEILSRVLFPEPDATTEISGAMLRLAPSISRLEIRSQHGFVNHNGRANVEFWSSHLDIWFTKAAKEKWMNGEARQCGRRRAHLESLAKGGEHDFMQILENIFKVSRDRSWQIRPFVESRTSWIGRTKGRFRHWLK